LKVAGKAEVPYCDSNEVNSFVNRLYKILKKIMSNEEKGKEEKKRERRQAKSRIQKSSAIEMTDDDKEDNVICYDNFW
jgi:hypothetical protein